MFLWPWFPETAFFSPSIKLTLMVHAGKASQTLISAASCSNPSFLSLWAGCGSSLDWKSEQSGRSCEGKELSLQTKQSSRTWFPALPLAVIGKNRIKAMWFWHIFLFISPKLQSSLFFDVININQHPAVVCFHINSDSWLLILTFQTEGNDDHQQDQADYCEA